jgi:heat shock protein HslJ
VKRAIILSAVLLTILAVMTGCDSTTSFEDISLEDTEWVMESYGEVGSLEDALPGVEVSLLFNSESKEFIGKTGCSAVPDFYNTYSGIYEVEGDKLSFPEGVWITQLKGEEEAGRQEEEYIGLFGCADSFEIVDGKLHIICDGDMIVYHKK